MKPAPFEYLAPDSLASALSILAERGADAKLLAGGQSLVPAMNFRLLQPSLLVDLNHLPGLDFVRRDEDGGLRLGAMVRQRRLEHDPLVARVAPLLREAVPFIAHPQIRNRGTLGGSLAHADPAAELPVVAVALGARLRLQSAAAERWLSAHEFFRGAFTTALAEDEMLVEVEIPAQPPRTGSAFFEFARRRGDYALAGVAAEVMLADGVCRQARLVYLNAGDGPVDARESAALLIGQEPSTEAVEAAVATAAEREIAPFGNVHASPEFQRHLARVLTRRALATAFERARASAE